MDNWLITLFNSIVLFFVALFLVRFMRRKSLSKATPFDFISYVIIAIVITLVSLNIIDNIYFGLITLAVWVVLPIAVDFAAMRSNWIYNLINGKERVLIKEGKVMEDNLSKERMTAQEFMQELRSKNAFNLADVEFALMETTGDINVSLKSDKKPVTAYDLGKDVGPKSESQAVILDGNIMNEALTNIGLNQDWLKVELEKKGVDLENVFIGQVDSSGDLYVDLFDDMIQVPKSQVKEMIYSNIEKTQSDLMSFYLETENKEAKAMYLKNAEKLKRIMKRLEPYLLR